MIAGLLLASSLSLSPMVPPATPAQLLARSGAMHEQYITDRRIWYRFFFPSEGAWPVCKYLTGKPEDHYQGMVSVGFAEMVNTEFPGPVPDDFSECP